MKSKILLLVLLTIFSLPKLYGQNCTSPPNCIQNIGTNPGQLVPFPFGQNMNSNTATTIADWHILSGVPTIGPGYNSTSGIEMLNGEGVFTCFNFEPNTEYQVCINAIVTSSQTSGNLVLEAHNGTQWITITNSAFTSQTLIEVSFSFATNNNSYNQLRVRVQSGFSTYSLSFDDIGVVEVPVVTATAMDACGSSTLRATTSGGKPVNVTWIPNDNLSSTTTNVTTARPCQTRTYTARFDSQNCFDGWTCTKEKVVTVVVNQDYNVSASPLTINGCGTSTLIASSTNYMDVTWTASSGEYITPNRHRVSVRPCKTTIYTAHFSCSNGCNYTRQVTVYVQQNTTVTATPTTINNCQSSMLTASSPNNMSVTWSTESGLYPPIGSGGVVTARPCKTTKYYATYRCLATGCTYLDSVTVVVNKNGGTNNIIANGICYGPIDLEYNATTPCPGSTYKWFGPKNPSIVLSTQSTLQLASTTINDYGNYMLEVTTPNGCIDTFYEPVIYTCCEVDADFDTVDCNPIRFINKTTDGQGNPILQGQWHWDFGDGNTSTIRNPSNLYTPQLGLHTICLIAVVEGESGTCCSKICKDIEVCDFTCDAKAAFKYDVINAGLHKVRFTDKSVGVWSPNSHKWWVNTVFPTTPPPPPTAPIYTGQTQDITFPGPGIYSVCLEVEYLQPNGTSCFDTWCEEVVVP